MFHVKQIELMENQFEIVITDRVGIDRARNCIPRNKRLFLNGWMNQILSFASEGMRTAAPAVRKPRCLRRPVYQERTSSLDMRFPPKRRKDLGESPRKKRLLCSGYMDSLLNILYSQSYVSRETQKEKPSIIPDML